MELHTEFLLCHFLFGVRFSTVSIRLLGYERSVVVRLLATGSFSGAKCSSLGVFGRRLPSVAGEVMACVSRGIVGLKVSLLLCTATALPI